MVVDAAFETNPYDLLVPTRHVTTTNDLKDIRSVQTHSEKEELSSTKWNWIAYLGGLLTFAAIIPQILHVYRKKSAKDLSYTFMFMTILGVSLLLLYAWTNRLKPHIINNSVFLFLYIILLYLKIHYEQPF